MYVMYGCKVDCTEAALVSLLMHQIISVQGLICHTHSGTPRTILYTSLNTITVIASSSGSGSGIGGVQNGKQDCPWCATVHVADQSLLI